MNKLIHIIESLVNQKSFEYEENHTSVNGWGKLRSGNWFYVERGITGIASISILSAVEIQISIPYSAHYQRKIYRGLIGFPNEYDNELKSPHGLYNLKLSLIPFSNIEYIGISDCSPSNDPKHDSNVMTVRGLEKHVIANLHNSLKNYAGIENELLEMYKRLTSMSKEFSNYEPLQYVFHAEVVQIISLNNGNIIGQLKIEDFMSDTYNISGQAVAVGKNAQSHYNNFNQSGQQQNLSEAANQIQQLLNQLTQTNSTTDAVTEAVHQKIKSDPNLKAKLLAALKAGGLEALKTIFNHPVFSIPAETIKGYLEAE